MELVLQSTGHPASPAVLSRKEANVYGDRDLLLCCRYVSGEIRRVHQVIEEGRGGQSGWTFVPYGVWPERQSDGVRCMDIAVGVRQVREDANAHPCRGRPSTGRFTASMIRLSPDVLVPSRVVWVRVASRAVRA